jgi:hypothetical protein
MRYILSALCGLLLTALPVSACPGYVGASYGVSYAAPIAYPQFVYAAPAIAYPAPAVSYQAAPCQAVTADASYGTPALLQSVPYSYYSSGAALGFFSYGGANYYHDGVGIRRLSFEQSVRFGGRFRTLSAFPGGTVAITRERGRLLGGRRDSITAINGGGNSLVQINERRGLLGRVRERDVTVVNGGGAGLIALRSQSRGRR